MNTFSLLLRRPLEGEQRFRLNKYSAVMCRLSADVFESDKYLIEYAQLRVLWGESAAKLDAWAKGMRIDPEKCFLHRLDGSRALDHHGLYMANLADNDYREWTAKAIKEHLTGQFYHGPKHEWSRPCSAVMVDVPINYVAFDPMTCRAAETIEYKDDAERYEKDGEVCVMVLQNRLGSAGDILPNMSETWWLTGGRHDELIDRINGVFIEKAVDFDDHIWEATLRDLMTFCLAWPTKQKFIALRNGTLEQAALVANWLDASCENVWISHNTSSHKASNMDPKPIYRWNYNPLLLNTPTG